MPWTIEVSEDALKSLRKLGKTEARRIVDTLRKRIAPLDDPRASGKGLKSSTLEGLWRYRVGDYRIICDIQDRRSVVLVIDIGHRNAVYRRSS